MSGQQPSQPQAPDMNALIAGAIQQQLSNMLPGVVAATMNDIGHALRAQASAATASVQGEEILTAPRKLASGHAIVLMRRLRYASPNQQLVVFPMTREVPKDPANPEGEKQTLTSFHFTIFSPNEIDMTTSKIVTLTEEENAELVRQMEALGVVVPVAFAMHVFGPETKGLPYFETPEDKQAREFAEAEAAAAAAGQSAAATTETGAANGAAAPAAASAGGDDEALVPSSVH